MASSRLALISLLVVAHGKRVVPGKVHVLTNDNFEHDTQAATGATTGDWFVEFYAPWCGHCRQLAPTWEKLAKTLKKKVTVAKVDVTKNRLLGQRFGITGFPSLLFFHHGKMYKYKGMRTVEALEKFALEGYKDGEGMDVPPEPSMIITIFMTLFDQYSALLEENMLLAMAVLCCISLVLALICVGMIICCCDTPRPPSSEAPAPGEAKVKKDQ
mmetsp:Transcript_33263/g.61835  ORF Transcript_33263/g.61835 Transcript_33263/m.61835 type:complete len:214 (-) Transcript_33263:366-1007(-)|eukprot:CAMPEP_0170195346 /NCGR_PEP_ID=MMETSP0040_2-20121228/61312_1 /TAXON_ID=641309 /ORGANISM="Lotharella oceanica, Strain CCMP622" /LENGTH=213 /DNA_ID=CAMNT_0010444481 /DNA_START=19 /DNA_END=660 /DNA_ORIENTATION=+